MRLGAEYFLERFLIEEAKLKKINSCKLSDLASLSKEKTYPTDEPDKALNGKTPAEKASMELRLGTTKWLSLIKKSNKEIKK